MTIYIHEFSTGIQAEKTADGGWVSLGFTGEYINKTIDPIPRPVQEAISNRDFAVAEGASSDKPAYIGREVAGYGSEWSVIAVVTRGRDDRGRSASVYRYFLSEGLGNLGKILGWLNAQKQAGQNIIFDPFDRQILEQPHEYSESEPDLSLRPELESLLESPPPIIIPSDSPCAPLIVNKMAHAIANGQLIAWGYNVEALEEPRGFKVIQPASTRAEDLLKKAIASKPNTPAPVSGERAIISAIKSLVMRDRVKPEQVETIENALGNPQIDDSYWESIFKGRGADKALKQGIYSADMVRILTLRAMVIPETLPEYLAWIGKEGKQQESKQVSDTFQAEIKKSFSQVSGQGTNLISRVYQGVVSIIPRLIKQPQLLDSIVWLLSSDKGLWGYFYSRQIKSEIDNDLSLMRYYGRGKQGVNFKLTGHKEWQKIFNEIEVYWRSRSGSQPQYQPLAELFSQLGNYQLSALFYHVCSGVVPKEVFYKLKRRGFHIQVYGIRAKREIGSLESLYLKTVEIGGQIVPVYLVAILMAVMLGLGFAGGRVTADKLENKSNTENISQSQNSPNPEVEEQPKSTADRESNNSLGNSEPQASTQTTQTQVNDQQEINNSLLKDFNSNKRDKAMNEFDSKTKIALINILRDSSNQNSGSSELSNPLNKDEIVKSLIEILSKDTNITLNIPKYEDNELIFQEEDKEDWVKAIYIYQNSKNNLKQYADGIINKNGKTVQQLKQDLEKKFN
ncbi:MAG: hypothetical protein QNJ32_02230 [Xenococcaceae cyanobacterium MO_167.B27]|nr:hypothetical protein [Xenococcaceae cyanobacterium MO_167.B27]